MIALLRLLREHEQAVEADFARFYHLDYRDRWRFDEHGRRLLTLRMIRARVRHLPPDSATGRATGIEQHGWTVGDYLLADVFNALTGKKHPARPKASKSASRSVPTRQRAEKLAAARRRKRRREEQLANGEIT